MVENKKGNYEMWLEIYSFVYIIIPHHFFKKLFSRFFFTHDQTNKKAKIPDSVVDSLLKRKLSDIICDNTKNMQFVPINAFLIKSKENPYKNCNSTKINKINVDGLFGKQTRNTLNIISH